MTKKMRERETFRMKFCRISRCCLIMLCCLFYSCASAQKYFINQKNIYNHEDVKYLYERKAEKYFIMGNYAIDRNGDGKIDRDNVEHFLRNAFTPTEKTLLILNWEGTHFDNFIYYQKSHPKFIEAESRFLELIAMVRRLRPHVKIGFYGIPFRNYNPKIKELSDYNKFDKI